jgi:membrane associated rhomboid family serine protease
MIPLRDVIPSRTTPWVTFTLIAVNALVFLYELSLAETGLVDFIRAYGLVPADYRWVSVLTSMFLHGGWLHVIGNLVSLWIFGDNVEDRLGHGRFLVFYVLSGAIAALVHTSLFPDSAIPVVGASGAIAGVMGAYLVLFPHSRILVLILLLFYVDIVEVPALFFLAFWFLMQLISGVGQLAQLPGENVGFWAHIGGFVAGVLTVFVFRQPERQKVAWWDTGMDL